MIPPKKHTQEDNVDSWLMSYADMITLLMCFFIIFVSVSEPKKDKFSLITDGIASKFGSVDLSTPFQGVVRSLQAVVENRQAFKDIAIEKTEKSVEMEMASGAFFKPNSAEFIDEKVATLKEVAESLATANFLQYRVVVEGHTSNAEVNSGLYPSNWELSSARASRIVRFFIEHGLKAQHMRAIGLADTQPKVPNLDAAGKAILENRARNERMVIKLERVGG